MAKLMKFPLDYKPKYCNFHHDYGHDMNKCVALKEEIETLIKRGKLVKYM